MGGSDEDGWGLFGEDDDGDNGNGKALQPCGLEPKSFAVAAGVPATEHPYFSEAPASSPGFTGSDSELAIAIEEYVPTACDLLSSARGSEGLALGASLRRVAASYIALVDAADEPSASSRSSGIASATDGTSAADGCMPRSQRAPASMADCERVARRCAAEAWQILQNGSRQEAVIHAHAFAHAIVAAASLARCSIGADPKPAISGSSRGAVKEAMRHADLALLLCPELPMPALHGLAARCDALCVAATGAEIAGDEDSAREMVIPDDIQAAPKAPPVTRPIPRRKFAELSVTRFREEMMIPAKPAVIEGHLEAAKWAAPGKWQDLRFWMRRHGHRSVPVELGVREDDAANSVLSSSSEAEGSMLIAEFVDRYLIPSNKACVASSERQVLADGAEAGEQRLDEWSATPVAYVAQHLLLVQLPELRADISVPHFCSLGTLRTVNVWVGTVGTVTALHYDEDDNFLVQVAGFKYVRLYAYHESERLYATEAPRDNAGHGASFSPVRAEYPDLEAYPEFAKAAYEETILGPGDMLFIPKRTWHYVRSLTTSISVNFWF